MFSLSESNLSKQVLSTRDAIHATSVGPWISALATKQKRCYTSALGFWRLCAPHGNIVVSYEVGSSMIADAAPRVQNVAGDKQHLLDRHPRYFGWR
jgi:hypothetical protein